MAQWSAKDVIRTILSQLLHAWRHEAIRYWRLEQSSFCKRTQLGHACISSCNRDRDNRSRIWLSLDFIQLWCFHSTRFSSQLRFECQYYCGSWRREQRISLRCTINQAQKPFSQKNQCIGRRLCFLVYDAGYSDIYRWSSRSCPRWPFNSAYCLL